MPAGATDLIDAKALLETTPIESIQEIVM